jgi:hypothetical protein
MFQGEGASLWKGPRGYAAWERPRPPAAGALRAAFPRDLSAVALAKAEAGHSCECSERPRRRASLGTERAHWIHPRFQTQAPPAN